MNLEGQFLLYPTVFLTKGYNRALICDTERQKYFLIPHLLYDILNNNSVRKISSAIDLYSDNNSEHINIISDYFKFLFDNDLMFFTENRDIYKSPELIYDYPGYISNCVIDISDNCLDNIILLLSQIDEILCRSLQIRLFSQIDIIDLKTIAQYTEGTVLEWIEYCIPYSNRVNLESLKDLFLNNERLRLIVVYGYLADEIIWEKTHGGGRITGIKQNIDSSKHCGVVNPAYFSTDLTAISESNNFNSCLNRKLGIDIKGNIKNCPSMPETFGNINNTPLAEAINKQGFKKYWDITKDKIHVCKDCEFRYICTDCRAYVEVPEDIFSKPFKCGYNPYISEWSEWSSNPIKQKVISYYEMEELVAERGERLNKETVI